MDRLEKKVLKNCTEILYKNFDPKEFVDFIIQEEILIEEEREYVMAEVARKKRVEVFLRYLKRKNNGFENLLKMFRKSETTWLLDPLVEERDRLRAAGEDYILVSRMSQDKIRKRLTEKQCLDLARFISKDWKLVAAELGFESSDTYQIESENRDDHRMAAFTMLNKWGQRKVNQANIMNLLSVLDANGLDYNETDIIAMFS